MCLTTRISFAVHYGRLKGQVPFRRRVEIAVNYISIIYRVDIAVNYLIYIYTYIYIHIYIYIYIYIYNIEAVEDCKSESSHFDSTPKSQFDPAVNSWMLTPPGARPFTSPISDRP